MILLAGVFICYVREDRERVDRLQDALEGAGIRTWRDTADIWPGQDWKLEIRRAIASGSLAFLACFSENSEQKASSYQHEELAIAVEQMRLRRPGVSWLIPLRFADCAIPDFDLGAGRMLDSLQRVDLPDGSWEQGILRLIGAVHRVLGGSTGASGDKDARPSTAPPVVGVTSGSAAAGPGANTLPADTAAFTGRERAARRDLGGCCRGGAGGAGGGHPRDRRHAGGRQDHAGRACRAHDRRSVSRPAALH